jgi:hypothetical protein
MIVPAPSGFHVSKSALGRMDRCGQSAWYALRMKRPTVPNEAMAFGSAVDRGVMVALKALRAGIPYTEVRDSAHQAAIEEVQRQAVAEVDIEEVRAAIDAFPDEVHADFALCALQEFLHTPIEGLGECQGYLDIRLASHEIWDTKTGTKGKPADAARSVELGFYVILYEAATGKKVPRVGYWTWVRSKTPHWQEVAFEVTDEFRRWAYECAAAYVRAVQADEVLNRARVEKGQEPINYSFPTGPKWSSLCSGCEYNPANGGICRMAITTEVSGD